MKVLSSIGLVLDMIGATILVWGTMRRLATWLRLQGIGPEHQQAKWYERIAVRVSTSLFGSSDPFQMNAGNSMQEISAIFWALIFLFLGFTLQLLGPLLGS